LIAVVPAPVLQLYVPPPDAVSVVVRPVQILFVPAIAAVGKAFTVTVLVALAVQPAAEVTVTV
jgi:hypothetical protein